MNAVTVKSAEARRTTRTTRADVPASGMVAALHGWKCIAAVVLRTRSIRSGHAGCTAAFMVKMLLRRRATPCLSKFPKTYNWVYSRAAPARSAEVFEVCKDMGLKHGPAGDLCHASASKDAAA